MRWHSYFFLLLILIMPVSAAPNISFLSVPPPGSPQEWVSGIVENVSPATYDVVLYIQVDGKWWGPKPTYENRTIPVRPDRFWIAQFVTDYPDKNDLRASRFVACLVPNRSVTSTYPPDQRGTIESPRILFPYPCEEREREPAVIRKTPYIVRNRTPLTGICFSPYVNGEDPDFTNIPIANITRRLTVLKNETTWVRSYGNDHGLQYFSGISRSLGMKNAAGAWLTNNTTANIRAINALVAGNRSAEILIVGSETLLRKNLTERELATYIQYVRKKVPGKAVGTADVYGEFLKNSDVVNASDVLFVHIFPFWENVSIDQAVNFTMAKYNATKKKAFGRPVVIGEYGWPDAGTRRQGAIPNRTNAARYFKEMTRRLNNQSIPYFYFSSYDEDWKTDEPDFVGPHWGLHYGDLTRKPGRLPLYP